MEIEGLTREEIIVEYHKLQVTASNEIHELNSKVEFLKRSIARRNELIRRSDETIEAMRSNINDIYGNWYSGEVF